MSTYTLFYYVFVSSTVVGSCRSSYNVSTAGIRATSMYSTYTKSVFFILLTDSECYYKCLTKLWKGTDREIKVGLGDMAKNFITIILFISVDIDNYHDFFKI